MARFSESLLTIFLNSMPPTEIYTLSLHDALPISGVERVDLVRDLARADTTRDYVARRWLHTFAPGLPVEVVIDRKSTRLNSSHLVISYAVFCLKKKNICHTMMRCYNLSGRINNER